MNLNNPSKVEVMGWNPQTLADYMKTLKLPGCDKVVMKEGISGAQFMQMTECDLHVFPCLYVPIITKIHSELSKGEQKRGFAYRSKAQMYPEQVFAQEEEIWESDEFDSDNDYEALDQDEGEDNYICALAEPKTAGQQDSDVCYGSNFVRPSAPYKVKPPRHSRPAAPQDSHSRDPVHDPSPAEKTSKAPHPPVPKMNQPPQKTFRAPAGQPNLHIDRGKKPGQSSPSQKDLPKSTGQPNLHIDRGKKPGQFSPPQKDLPKSKGSTVKAPGSSSSKSRPEKAPKPTDPPNRVTKLTPAPPVPTQPAKVSHSKPEPREGLDPNWYGGKMTRYQAEDVLREMNKDGAFVVRDSSNGSAEHPYTLMLLKEGKVYNIKIRNQGNYYSLGTGLKSTKSFPGVKEMITHHTHTPMLLIDATDPSSEAQSQSCLLHPAGL